MRQLLQTLLDRLREPSTIRTGITLLAGAIGVTIQPELVTHIVSAVAAIVSIIAITTKEEKKNG